MKAAFTEWEGRVAPVFDVARKVRIVEVDDGRVTAEKEMSLPLENPAQRAFRLAGEGIEVLVCGAVSRPVEAALISCDIRVHSFVAGNITDVIRDWLRGDLVSEKYAMPGCRGRGRRGHGARGTSESVKLCVCPRCGRVGPHEWGVPCSRTYCPECGSPLRRQENLR
jgi:predicted Fe-Mo cluster-binding NifX family protein